MDNMSMDIRGPNYNGEAYMYVASLAHPVLVLRMVLAVAFETSEQEALFTRSPRAMKESRRVGYMPFAPSNVA